MSFNDIFKSSFLENVSEFSMIDTLLGLAAALVISLFIFVIYKKTLTSAVSSIPDAFIVLAFTVYCKTPCFKISKAVSSAFSSRKFRTRI